MIRIGMPVFVWQGQHTTAEALWIRLAALVVLVLLGVLAASRKGRKRKARKEVFPARCQRNAPVAFSRAILCRLTILPVPFAVSKIAKTGCSCARAATLVPTLFAWVLKKFQKATGTHTRAHVHRAQ